MHYSTVVSLTALLVVCANSLALPNPAPKAVASIFARQEGCPDIPQCIYATDGSNLQGVRRPSPPSLTHQTENQR
jgi:hypothetical protein